MRERVHLVVGTLGDRDGILQGVLAAHKQYGHIETVTVFRGLKWGAGCNHAIQQSAWQGLFLLCADDMIPHPGYLDDAINVTRDGRVPVSHAVAMDGRTWLHPGYDDLPAGEPSPWTRMFLIRRAWWEQVGPVEEEHDYYIDNDYSERLNAAGYQVVSCPSFKFTHVDPPRHWQTREGLEADLAWYEGRA